MSRTDAVRDALLVVAAFALTYTGLGASGFTASGVWAVIASFGVATWRLHAAGEAWRDVGWRLPRSWPRMLLATVVIFLIAMLLAGWFVGALAQRLGWPPQDFSRFAALRGDPVRLVLWLTVAWSTAAIGEELVFRGFLMARLLSAFGGSRAAGAAAVLVQAALFGAGHAYLGVRGVAAAIAVGLVFGSAWLLNGRQLAPLVAAHGVIDTISLLGIFAGRA
jgi:hypothetical protein